MYIDNDVIEAIDRTHELHKGIARWVSRRIREIPIMARKIKRGKEKLKAATVGGKVKFPQSGKKGLSRTGKIISRVTSGARSYANKLEATGMMPNYSKFRSSVRNAGKTASRHLTPRGKQALKYGTIGVVGEKIRRVRSEGKKRREESYQPY